MNNPLLFDTAAAGLHEYTETEKYEYDDVFTTVGLTDASQYKTVRFILRQENLILHWRNAYLEIKGQIVKIDGTVFANDDKIAPCHNAAAYLFSNGKISLGGTIIENVNNIGFVTTLLHLTSCN